MKILYKIISIVFLLAFAVFSTGCNKNELYPASDIQITKVDPYNIIPTSNNFDSIDDGVITMKLLNSIPCDLISYDLSYRTVLNDPIESLSISQIRTNLPLAEKDTEVELTLKPYTQQLLNLLQSTSSEISPIRATVILHFRDVNKNDIYREASFLLYKYESTSSE